MDTNSDHTSSDNPHSNHFDLLIVGGGVIGLSLAWEMAQHGAKVCVADRAELGMEASWAGAGMIPPGPPPEHWGEANPYEQLEGLSQRLHAEWHEKLRDLTNIDNEYHRCGALYLARDAAEAEALDEQLRRWKLLGIACEPVDDPRFERAYLLPEEAQIRNPRHLRALIAACATAGVSLRPNVAVQNFKTRDSTIQQANTSAGPIHAEKFCLTAGCWSNQLTAQLGIDLPVRPIRGQMVLLNGPPGLLRHTIIAGSRYLVPRRDGRILVGSTMEDVGFVKENTPDTTADLLNFSAAIAPEVESLSVETQWSGLRPGTADGLPFLGRLPNFENAWLATGHFRAGLQLSPATAVVMRALMLGQQPPVDVSSLGVER